MLGSHPHLASLTDLPVSQGIYCLLQWGTTTPGHSPTHSGALCSTSALFYKLLSTKNHFKTSAWRAAPPLPLYSKVELIPFFLDDYKNPQATSNADGLVLIRGWP
jgi:hypothetical protein